jgi:hypothetical protein
MTKVLIEVLIQEDEIIRKEDIEGHDFRYIFMLIRKK